MLKICEWCGKEFNVIPARANTAKCCSKECRCLRHSKIMRGWRGPKKKRIKKICKWCGKEFGVKPSHANRRVFCSVACMGLWNSKNRHGENHQSWLGGKIKLNCKICEIEFEAPPSANRKVCSIKCMGLLMSKSRSGEKHWNWRGGLSLEPYGPDFDDRLKKEVRARDNQTCVICGKAGWAKKVVHHINYCKTDNRPENLITLCVSCHGKTNHNRQYWEGILSPVAIENGTSQTNFLSLHRGNGWVHNA